MEYTSAEANKLLSRLKREEELLLQKERLGCEFTAATVENLDDARPEYDYRAVQRELAVLEEKVRKVKHAINSFNATHEIPGFGMTLDCALVYIPQLTRRIEKLQRMSNRLPKERLDSGDGSFIEYRYANYSVAEAEADYIAAAEELSRLQNALDVENNTVKFEIEF